MPSKSPAQARRMQANEVDRAAKILGDEAAKSGMAKDKAK